MSTFCAWLRPVLAGFVAGRLMGFLEPKYNSLSINFCTVKRRRGGAKLTERNSDRQRLPAALTLFPVQALGLLKFLIGGKQRLMSREGQQLFIHRLQTVERGFSANGC